VLTLFDLVSLLLGSDAPVHRVTEPCVSLHDFALMRFIVSLKLW